MVTLKIILPPFVYIELRRKSAPIPCVNPYVSGVMRMMWSLTYSLGGRCAVCVRGGELGEMFVVYFGSDHSRNVSTLSF